VADAPQHADFENRYGRDDITWNLAGRSERASV
jgi:hypothetical protein